MQLFPRPDDEYPQSPRRFAMWHASNHPLVLSCLFLWFALFAGYFVLTAIWFPLDSLFDVISAWLFRLSLIAAFAFPLLMLLLALRVRVRLKRENLCPGCLSGKNSGDVSCPACGMAWAPHVRSGPRERIGDIRAYASRQTMRSPTVLTIAALVGAFVLNVMLRATTGFDLFRSLGVPREATSAVLGTFPVLFWVVPFMVLRRTARIQQHGLCPKCLYPMGRDDDRCPECGRERGAGKVK